MEQYKVSVILIYKNNEKTINDCLESVLTQPFPNIEIICVNNGSKDSSEDTVKSAAMVDSRIKLMKLPAENDLETARKAGLGIASGKFVVFLSAENKFDTDIVKELYYKPVTDYKLEENHLYRRIFLENDEEILDIINKLISEKMEEAALIEAEKSKKSELLFDNFQRITADNIKNSTYELTCRFNRLEKTFYEKDCEYKSAIENASKPMLEHLEKNTKQIYEDIAKAYDYINSEINKKGCEINKLYDEITKNYHYTEDLISQRYNDGLKISDDGRAALYDKINEIEKELVTRYVNLKRLLDLQIDEVDSRIKGLSPAGAGGINGYEAEDIKKNVSANLDNVYSVLNKTSGAFYEDLSNMYREMNEKLNKQREESLYLADKKLSEIKSELQKEFDKKLEQLRKEINN